MPDLSHYLHDAEAGEVWVRPTDEMLWWTRTFGRWIAPAPGAESAAAKLLGVVLVTPSAHFANMSLYFQQYLYDVFHQTKVAKVGHYVCMPLINMMVLVFFAQFSVWSGSGAFHVDAALVTTIALCLWYVAQATFNGVPWLGVAMVPVTLATYAAAMAYWHAFGLPPEQATWVAPTEAPYNPLLWIALLSFVQAASHGPEPKLPPRVSGTAHWMSLWQFLFGRPGARHGPARVVWHAIRAAAQIVFGALDEFWASWRLIPFNVLELMAWLGYRPETYARTKALARRAIAHGDPAIDFIGVGGGAVIRDPDARP
jgi:hypothetical protein